MSFCLFAFLPFCLFDDDEDVVDVDDVDDDVDDVDDVDDDAVDVDDVDDEDASPRH